MSTISRRDLLVFRVGAFGFISCCSVGVGYERGDAAGLQRRSARPRRWRRLRRGSICFSTSDGSFSLDMDPIRRTILDLAWARGILRRPATSTLRRPKFDDSQVAHAQFAA